MATSSIFNNIRITNNEQAELLVNAMETAEKVAKESTRKPVEFKVLHQGELKGFLKGK
ncbi:MAG: hypothetical protein LBO70_02560 [Clostridiales Family XIII bacterium]|jgi:hypothetical protein|nr:hypothetical protein [Clostridiales Family XIII bacterium]